MNRIGKMLLSLVALGLSYSVHALTSENRYETIIDRNIFRLVPMPPPEKPTNNVDSTLNREVKLTGISNIGGLKNAWFMIPAKPPSKDPPLYLNLSEGQQSDFLEVISISEEEGEVKILHTKNPMTLSLKNDSLKAAPVAAVPAVAVPVAANVVVPQPPTTSTSYSPPAPSYGTLRPATVAGGTTPTFPTTTGQNADGSGMRTIPTRQLRLSPAPNQQATANEKPVDPLTQRAMMEVDHALKERQGLIPPPLPPLPH